MRAAFPGWQAGPVGAGINTAASPGRKPADGGPALRQEGGTPQGSRKQQGGAQQRQAALNCWLR